MTGYIDMERDFISRTLQLIEQYDRLKPQVSPEAYEGTLLINCLLGLLIYPQQVAHNRQQQQDNGFSDWLIEERLLSNVQSEWHIYPVNVKSAGYTTERGNPKLGIKSYDPANRITKEDLTVRRLLRQLRNAVAHAWFHVESRDGQLYSIVFYDENDPAGMGFHVELPITQLRAFVRKLAISALERLDRPEYQI